MARSLSGSDLAAGQGHGLEYTFVAERRFLVGFLLLIRPSCGGLLMSLFSLVACIHTVFNPD